jgi:predicted nucleic acid-binding protein
VARLVRRIVNASPLILLSKIDRLDLLGVGGVGVFTPRAVLDEVRAYPSPDSNLERALRTGQIHEIVTPVIPQIIQAWDLGAGESSVLAVAHADREAEAVLDDGEVRRGDVRRRSESRFEAASESFF